MQATSAFPFKFQQFPFYREQTANNDFISFHQSSFSFWNMQSSKPNTSSKRMQYSSLLYSQPLQLSIITFYTSSNSSQLDPFAATNFRKCPLLHIPNSVFKCLLKPQRVQFLQLPQASNFLSGVMYLVKLSTIGSVGNGQSLSKLISFIGLPNS